MARMISTIGRHYSYQVVVKLSRTLPELWLEASREAHRSDGLPILKAEYARLRQAGLFALCREVRDRDGEPLSEAHQAADRLLRFFSRREGSYALASAFCTTATELACAVETVRQAAKLETDAETRKTLDIGFFTLKRQLSRLLSTGVLAELPVSARMSLPEQTQLEKLAAVLYERRQVFHKASRDTRFEGWVRMGLAETMGCRLFDSIRAQERHRAEIGIEGLARHIGRPHPRFRRALYADAALGVHEVFEIAVQHAGAIARAKGNAQLQRRRRNASLVSWITVVELLRTRILEGVQG